MNFQNILYYDFQFEHFVFQAFVPDPTKPQEMLKLNCKKYSMNLKEPPNRQSLMNLPDIFYIIEIYLHQSCFCLIAFTDKVFLILERIHFYVTGNNIF